MAFGRLGALGGGVGKLGSAMAAAASVPAWVPSGASAALDFVNDRAWSVAAGAGTSTSRIAVARASVAGVYNTDGSISTVANNVARLTCDEILNEAAGLLVEKSAVNPAVVDFTTAVVGTIGSGGALPTGVTRTEDSSGLSCSVVAKDASGITVRWQGTANGNLLQLVLGRGAVSPGDVVTASFSAQLVAGSYASLGSVFISLEEFNAGGSFQNRQLFGGFAADHALTSQYFSTDMPWPVEYRNRTIDASVAFAGLGFVTLPAASGAVDCTIRFERASLEKSAFRTTYQPAASRAADDVTLSNASSYIGSAPWTLGITADAPTISDTGVVWQADDGTANNRVTLRMADYELFLTVKRGGSTEADVSLGIVPPLSRFNAQVAISSTGYAMSVNGKPAKTGSITPPTGLTALKIGSGTEGYWNGYIQALSLFGSAQSGAAQAALSLAGITFWDDFDRADGAPGTAPTGQVYGAIPNNGAGIVLAAIASKKLVTNDAGLGGSTFSYTGVDLGTGVVPKIMSASIVYPARGLGGGGNLISNQQGITATANITDQSLHTIYAPNLMNWSIFKTGVASNLDQTNARTNATANGAARTHLAWAVKGDAQILRTNTGELQRFVDSRLNTYRGRYIIYESVGSLSAANGNYVGVAAR